MELLRLLGLGLGLSERQPLCASVSLSLSPAWRARVEDSSEGPLASLQPVERVRVRERSLGSCLRHHHPAIVNGHIRHNSCHYRYCMVTVEVGCCV